ncbi:Xaa-Pro dipeptidyl-peptidase [Actinokineospora diospyrosa]|uniref:Xaa-Pro dipeptidyl-peptidase n=1 Tax=Actinokineospora diospyrosa TaxID=103728 RepID=A0ABT1IAK6_9PSEU|nr:Xaa-Pro dipeptidyl-peptidase [Actinokineospora diospyrosa]MCP2269386.1 X-Pro dipeptidyl-peptidase [Actinokineospora diospyrosa]
MRSLPRVVLVAAVVVGGGVPLATTAANARESTTAMLEERVYVETSVDTDNNGRLDRVAIDISRPAGSTRVPVVFEHSPYVKGLNTAPNYNPNVDRLPQEGLFGLTAAGGVDALRPAPDLPDWYDDYFVPRGYAVVMGHSIGTGDSDGCPTTGDRNETLGATAVIDWLNGRAKGYNASGSEVQASWSTGNVGMIGISYNGTLPNAVAASGVAGLKAIVPIAAISRWYDYYRANGLVVAPGGYQGEDADVLAKAVVGNASRCSGQLANLTRDQDRVSGDATAFWQQRDYLRDANKVTAGVFVMHGQADWNVKGQQYAQWWEALKANNVPRKIWLHRGGHGAPSRTDYQATVLKWFDYHLKGIDNGIMTEPKAEVQFPDGTWQRFADWPDPAARDAVFRFGATSATAPGTLTLNGTGGEVKQTFVDNGRTTNATSLVASPDSANGSRLVYRSEALPSQVKLSGTPRVTLRMAVENRKDANVTALLVDYGGSTPVIVTRGWIDPQNRAGSTSGQAVVQGQEYDLTFALQPKDHVFAAGRRIGLVVISTDYDYTLRPTAGTQLRLAPGQSSVTIPLTGVSQPNGDFSVSVNPASGTGVPGQTITTTVSTATTSGSPQPLTLTATGLPTGATATFTPATVTSGAQSTLSIALAQNTQPGNHAITIRAQGTSTAKTAGYTLQVPVVDNGCLNRNDTRVPIPDNATVESSVRISGCPQAPSATSKVDVDIEHTYQGDLVVTLVAPDGTPYVLHNRTGGSADNIVRTYTVNLSAEPAEGLWKLRVQDAATNDVGAIRAWALNMR